MRYILTILLFFLNIFSFSQLVDDFSDGDFISNPSWVGQTSNFEVNTSNKLHLLAPAITDTSYLSTLNSLIDNAEWSFLVNLDFGTSSANLARVYLVSDQQNLKQALNGYFIQIGSTADEVSLYRQDGLVITEIIDGTDGFVGSSTVNVRVKATRNTAGDWTLLADNTGAYNYINQGTTNDLIYSLTNYIGVFCKYTSTRSDKFYFDDIIVSNLVTVDTIKPQITSIDVISNQIVHVWFSEKIDITTAENVGNYSVNNGLGQPASAQILSSNSHIVELSFSTPFQNQLDNTLTVQNVEDDSSNVMVLSTIHFQYNQPYFASYKDIVITEFMADPSPSVALPEFEYIELYNRTNQTIYLEDWTISDGSSSVTLVDFPFFPQTYLLFCANGIGSQYGIFNTYEGTLPTLNNSGDAIVIKDNNGTVVDSINYTEAWYNNQEKADGGWSLELKNINSPCNDASNWVVSTNQNGGTPGYENSVFTDNPNTDLPKIIESYLESDSIIHFIFDKSIMNGDISIEPIIPFTYQIISGNEIKMICSDIEIGINYTVEISNFNDCWTNTMADYGFNYSLPKQAEIGDIIINEILFNPKSNGSDFIELVNVSSDVLSLNQVFIANISDGITDNITPLSTKQILWYPNDYLVLTKDSLDIIQDFSNYETGHFIELNLPLYNNDSGTVIILNNENLTLDKFSYSEDMQFALIDDLNGKSLERLSFLQPTQLVDNWHTGSENEGWGTPGYLNSQTINPELKNDIYLSQPIFSPNNDGYQDVLEITYQLINAEQVMDVNIYSSNGELVRELKDNFYPGKTGTIIWDGITDNNNKADIGSYIIGIAVFDLSGNIKKYKLVGVLATQL